MKKLLPVLFMFFFFTGLLFSCSNTDNLGIPYTPITVKQDLFNLSAKADSSTYIEATVGASVQSINVLANNKDTTIHNTFYMKAYENALVNTYHDTIVSDWYKIMRTKDDPATFRVYVGKNKTNQVRKLILTLNGVATTPAKVTIKQEP
nr:DUF4252 domain-containing protein [uncultured Bacteroides sp.]